MRFSDLQEGPNDPGIFKAIFLAGGPGSGKGYVVKQLGLQARGLKVINSDDAFEYLMRKRNLSFNMPPEEQPDRDVARGRAKEITKTKQDLYLDGRLGIIIDGTAKDPNKMAKLKAELESIGYQTMIVFVNTSLRTALQRNLLRDRKVPTDIVVQSHNQVQNNKNALAQVFASDYVEVNNDDNANFNEHLKRIDKFINAPVTATARDWISKVHLQKVVKSEGVIYNVDTNAPMDDSEVLVIGGAGRYTLSGLRNKARREAGQLVKGLEVDHGQSFRSAAQNVKQLSNTLNTVVTAYDELNSIRKQGGTKSKGIRNEDVQGKPKVYVDMDGVLANFYAGVTRVTGHEEPRDMALQDIEDTMASFKGTDFFYKLPKYEQTDQLIAMINAATGGDWYILSSPLKYDREGSAKYKTAWIRDKLKIQPKGMHFQSDKAQFATQPDGTPNILIDDYPKYLNSWKEKGGIGVQYKGHAGNIKDVAATLDQHFSKKKVAEETILTEEQLVEGFLDSAKDYLGNAYTNTVADIKSNIVDLKQAGIVIKDVLTDPKQTEIVNAQLGKQINMLVKQMSSTANAATTPMIKFIQQNILPVVRVDGIKGFLGRLGVYGVLKFVSTQLAKITDVVKDQLLGLMSDVVKQVSSTALTMSSFMGIFDNLSTVKKYFLDVLSYIKSKLMLTQISRPTETVQIDELADKPYSYSQNVKTPDKRAYRFQTDAGQLYRVQVFNRRKDDANKLEIHFDLTDMKTGKPESGVTGSGDAVRVFSTVADILQKEVTAQDPTGVIIASKADDESRVKLYRTLARRATKLMPDYEVSRERQVTGADGNPYLTIELAKK